MYFCQHKYNWGPVVHFWAKQKLQFVQYDLLENFQEK